MTREDLNKKLQSLFIRFDTSPKLYQKSDYLALLLFLKNIIDELPEDDSMIDNSQLDVK